MAVGFMAGEVVMKMSKGSTGVWRSWCSHGDGLAAPMWALHGGQLGAAPAEQARPLGPSHFPANPISPSKEAGTALLASHIFFPREKHAEGPMSEPQLFLGPLPPGLSSHSGDRLASGPGPHGALPLYTLIISQILCFCFSLQEP